MDDLNTIRNTLFTRHAGAVQNLDRLRHDALPRREMTSVEFLREIFRPYRRAWMAMAAAWLLLVAVELSHTNTSGHNPSTQPSPEAVAAWFVSLKSYEAFAQADRRP